MSRFRLGKFHSSSMTRPQVLHSRPVECVQNQTKTAGRNANRPAHTNTNTLRGKEMNLPSVYLEVKPKTRTVPPAVARRQKMARTQRLRHVVQFSFVAF